MRIGVVLPQIEIGSSPEPVKTFAQAADQLGFDSLSAYDHVVGASAAKYDKQRLKGPYREQHSFHEPLVLFGFLAAITQRIKLTTGILILPQRQTALLAKQAAEVDVLSKGRLQLGIGSGWNDVEYTALGVPFEHRGRLLDDQLLLLRQLWTQPLVNYHSEFHQIPDAGINPLPVQRPIPMWFGGHHENMLKRVAQFGEGWMPLFSHLEPGMSRAVSADQEPAAAIRRLRDYATQFNRNPADIKVECRLSYSRQTADDWRRLAELFDKAGATHLSLVTMNAGFEHPEQHIDAMLKMRDAIREVVAI